MSVEINKLGTSKSEAVIPSGQPTPKATTRL